MPDFGQLRRFGYLPTTPAASRLAAQSKEETLAWRYWNGLRG